MRRRRSAQPESLTSLLDVLFILVFATVVQLAVSRTGGDDPAAAAAPPPPPDAGVPVAAEADGGVAAPADTGLLRRRAIGELTRSLEGRAAVVVRIGADGVLRALDGDGGAAVALGAPLLERVPDPDVALAYLGDRSSDMRVCRIVALRLGLADLRGYLVVIAPDVSLEQLPVALVAGLRRDAERCLQEQQGAAVVVDPTTAIAPAEEP
jgi:hypothetical protein